MKQKSDGRLALRHEQGRHLLGHSPRKERLITSTL